MNQDEIKTMMLSFERLKAKGNKSKENKATLADMWQKMPQVVMHQITVIEEYQEAFDRVKAENEMLKQLTGIPETLIELGEERRKNEQLQAEMQDYIGLANIAECFVDLKTEHELYESIRQDLKGYLAKVKGGE